MSASAGVIINEMISGSLSTAFSMLKILIPLMIIIELLMVYNIMEKLANKMQFLGKILGIKAQSLFPLLVAVVMGIAYGAGTLIEINKQTPISKKDLTLIGIFIFLCHGIIETTLLFAVAGANIFVVLVVRLLIAILVTAIFARLPMIKKLDCDSSEK